MSHPVAAPRRTQRGCRHPSSASPTSAGGRRSSWRESKKQSAPAAAPLSATIARRAGSSTFSGAAFAAISPSRWASRPPSREASGSAADDAAPAVAIHLFVQRPCPPYRRRDDRTAEARTAKNERSRIPPWRHPRHGENARTTCGTPMRMCGAREAAEADRPLSAARRLAAARRAAHGTQHRLRVHVTGETELYNLQTDPFELDNQTNGVCGAEGAARCASAPATARVAPAVGRRER